MSLNWQTLRTWNGSQQSAFEELCCQIAHSQEAPHGSTFQRKGTPDAGVECYWKLLNGDEWAWQAKYFRSVPGKKQWEELDDSVKTALDKHPSLTRYFICLPLDRADPRRPDQVSFMDKWEIHVKKWRTWALNNSRTVDFVYWGEHELWNELSLEEHRGRRFFWFHEEAFSQTWFQSRLDEAIAQAGPRYTPAINVELPIVQVFHGLGRTNEFYECFRTARENIELQASKGITPKLDFIPPSDIELVQNVVSNLLFQLASFDVHSFEPVDLTSLRDTANKLAERVSSIIEILQEIDRGRRNIGHATLDDISALGDNITALRDKFSFELYFLNKLRHTLREFIAFLSSAEARSANIGALLIVGDAGMGKTHLLCDIAEHRIAAHLPTLLLLGEQFGTEAPWTQMTRLLSINCTKDELLGALAAAAEAAGGRSIILIDALNEGEGKRFWSRHLGAIIAALRHYPSLGLAISVRSSYERLIVPDGLVPEKLERVDHQGFAGHEEDAAERFFGAFGIARPSVPLLAPEFSNPLFLKLFCQGLADRGLVTIPPGLQGITTIFGFFVESVNEKVCRPECVDTDPKAQIVELAINKVAQWMAEKDVMWIVRDEAKRLIDTICPRDSYEHSLFRHLIAEGVLVEDVFLAGEGIGQEGIRFAFERFADHRIATYLLDMHLDAADYTSAFRPGGGIYTRIADEVTCWRHRGLIEAFSIQLPERIQREFIEVASHSAAYVPVRTAFLQSMIWRKRTAFNEAARHYINSHIIRDVNAYHNFLHTLLSVAVLPDHPYNADRLHKYLLNQALPDRDISWSCFLSENYESGSVIARLVDWAWSPSNKQHIEDDSIRLCGFTLGWFLTSSNRFLRDGATKALVHLLTDRIHLLRQILKAFIGVNDPYVEQRLWAVAYGCSLRCLNNEELEALAQDTFTWVFSSGEPPTDLLTRDYARGIIETAIHKGLAASLDLTQIRPPYRSVWSNTIPTDEELQRYGDELEPDSDAALAWRWLHGSVIDDGDFARYVIDPAIGHFSSHCLVNVNPGENRASDEPSDPVTAFVNSLTKHQKETWEKYLQYRDMQRTVITSEMLRAFVDEHYETGLELSGEQIALSLTQAERDLYRALGKNKRQILEDVVFPFLDNPRQAEHFNAMKARRWLLMRVLELGWTAERFGAFDRYAVRNNFRSSHKAERIGKKYQWIAFYELMARIADNYQFAGNLWHENDQAYEGPWQITQARDLDPSWLLKKTSSIQYGNIIKNTWWCPTDYDVRAREQRDIEWLHDVGHLPKVEPLIEVTNPDDSSRWLVLSASYDWRDATRVNEGYTSITQRNIWYMLRSYIVRKGDANAMFEWAKAQDFAGRWMPESQPVWSVYLGEFYWAPAYLNSTVKIEDQNGWTRGNREEIPHNVLVPVEQYVWEGGGYDCSIDDTIQAELPAKWLAEHLKLDWRATEGAFVDSTGLLIAFDPSIQHPGPSALLVRRDTLLSYLEQADYELVWTVLGEKHLLGGHSISGQSSGHVTISGAYYIEENLTYGTLRATSYGKSDTDE